MIGETRWNVNKPPLHRLATSGIPPYESLSKGVFVGDDGFLGRGKTRTIPIWKDHTPRLAGRVDSARFRRQASLEIDSVFTSQSALFSPQKEEAGVAAVQNLMNTREIAAMIVKLLDPLPTFQAIIREPVSCTAKYSS